MSAVRRPVVSFLTDYGLRDGFVGVCHGVIARGCPEAHVIDLTHDVPRHDVRSGALLLRSSIEFLPEDAVHLAVVDPGVGTARRGIAIRAASGACFVGPDNGLLGPAVEQAGGIAEAIDLAGSPLALTPVSATFHGRDVFAPVAAALAGGRSPAEVGTPLDAATLTPLQLTRAVSDGDALVAHVQYVDGFGNLQLDAEPAQLAPLRGAARLAVSSAAWDLPAQAVRHGVTFADVEAGELLLYEDAHRRLAIAVNRGSAAERLGVAVGDELRLTPGAR